MVRSHFFTCFGANFRFSVSKLWTPSTSLNSNPRTQFNSIPLFVSLLVGSSWTDSFRFSNLATGVVIFVLQLYKTFCPPLCSVSLVVLLFQHMHCRACDFGTLNSNNHVNFVSYLISHESQQLVRRSMTFLLFDSPWSRNLWVSSWLLSALHLFFFSLGSESWYISWTHLGELFCRLRITCRSCSCSCSWWELRTIELWHFTTTYVGFDLCCFANFLGFSSSSVSFVSLLVNHFFFAVVLPLVVV